MALTEPITDRFYWQKQYEAVRAENLRLRVALAEVREKLFGASNPLHAIEEALVPLDHALNELQI